jgi:hypothetical protein
VSDTTSLIAYRRSWKRTFAFSVFTAAVALLLAVYMWPLYGNGLSTDGIRPKVFFVGMFLCFGVNVLGSLWIAITVASIRRDVCVTLDTEALTCSIPGELVSKSFSVALEDITEINKIDSDSGPEVFRIHTQSGMFDLYGNYGIPARRIVNEIAKLRPSVIIGTT